MVNKRRKALNRNQSQSSSGNQSEGSRDHSVKQQTTKNEEKASKQLQEAKEEIMQATGSVQQLSISEQCEVNTQDDHHKIKAKKNKSQRNVVVHERQASTDNQQPSTSTETEFPDTKTQTELASQPSKTIQLAHYQKSGPSSSVETVSEASCNNDLEFIRKQIVKPGVKGRKIPLLSNHIEIKLGSVETVYHYDIDIKPNFPKARLGKVIEIMLQKHFPASNAVSDGRKNIYAAHPLTGNLTDIICDEIKIPKDKYYGENTFKVEMKFANSVDLTPLKKTQEIPYIPQDVFQCVNIIIRSAPAVAYTSIGRSLFFSRERVQNLSAGVEMQHGFYQSAIRGWKPLLNVDAVHKAFTTNMSLLDVLKAQLGSRANLQRELYENQKEAFGNFIKDLKVAYEIPNIQSRKTYTVYNLNSAADECKIPRENKTVAEYFQNKKGYRLRFPKLPTLSVNKANTIHIPLELCSLIEGQPLGYKSLSDIQRRQMIEISATNTDERKENIKKHLDVFKYNDNPCIKEFDLHVSDEFEKINGRILAPPKLRCVRNMIVEPYKGMWRSKGFNIGATINRWTILTIQMRDGFSDKLRSMAKMLEDAARFSGMQVKSKLQEPFINIGSNSLASIKEYFNSHKNYDIIFVVVQDGTHQYSHVKIAAEVNVGCLTQCVKLTTLLKMKPQTASNLILKVNSKLNGINHILDPTIMPPILKNEVCMIMGADVTHPRPGSLTPSVAAVTASHELDVFKYNFCYRLQPPKKEIIEDLQAIVKEQLLFFKKMSGKQPTSLVFFRDGVSEGQFQKVVNDEVSMIRAACASLNINYKPKLTFVVVQKRHHTRLFPVNVKDSEDSNNNVPAGTCVDTVITHPFMQNFYLVSHASIKGVARPTKYCTLWDENMLDNDQLEELAYYLCHMFSRCNRSVSYPAPTYNAHLAAARAKVYIENNKFLNLDNLKEEYEKILITDEIRKGRPMFFV